MKGLAIVFGALAVAAAAGWVRERGRANRARWAEERLRAAARRAERQLDGLHAELAKLGIVATVGRDRVGLSFVAAGERVELRAPVQGRTALAVRCQNGATAYKCPCCGAVESRSHLCGRCGWAGPVAR
jgi:hypothetical protein